MPTVTIRKETYHPSILAAYADEPEDVTRDVRLAPRTQYALACDTCRWTDYTETEEGADHLRAAHLNTHAFPIKL